MGLSAKELYLEVWWVNEGVRQKMVMSRFAYGRTMPNTRSTLD